MHHDLVVIGSGPGGASAALEAAGMGLNVAVIDRGRRVGGSFVHTCALPNRVLREAAMRPRQMGDGIDLSTSVPSLTEWIQRGVDRHLPPIESMLEGSGVTILRGSASLRSPTQISVEGESGKQLLDAAHIILAPGSQPRRPPGIPLDGAVVCDSDSLLHMAEVPRSATVLGGGFVGCELACTLAKLGSAVTLIDQRRRILRMLDGDIAELLRSSMERLGIRLQIGDKIKEVRREQNGSGWHGVVELENEGDFRSEKIIVALGREPNVDSLGLDEVGINRSERGWIEVDASFRTTCSTIYAIGDAIGPPMLGGVSALQGRLAVRAAMGLKTSATLDLPISLFTIPEVSMVGITEESCREMGIDYRVGTALYSEAARSHIRAETDGMLKLIYRSDDGTLLGVHIIGSEASELIHLGASIVNRRGNVNEIADLPYAYPTFSQLYELAAHRGLRLQAQGSQRISA